MQPHFYPTRRNIEFNSNLKNIKVCSVVTRQAPNIEKDVIKSRHWKFNKRVNQTGNQPLPPPGNFRLHNKNCVTCLRMEDGKK